MKVAESSKENLDLDDSTHTFNSFLDSGNFCSRLITFANSLDRMSGSRLFDTLIVFLKDFFGEKNSEKSRHTTTKKHEKIPSMQSVEE